MNELIMTGPVVWIAESSLVLSVLLTGLLLLKSIRDFSLNGPQIKEEVRQHYFGYSVYAMLRLAIAACAIIFVQCVIGAITWYSICVTFGSSPSGLLTIFAEIGAVVGITIRQFSHALLFNPSRIVTTSHYRTSRFIPLWTKLSPKRLYWIDFSIVALVTASNVVALLRSEPFSLQQFVFIFGTGILFGIGVLTLKPRLTKQAPRRGAGRSGAGGATGPMNLVMIGSDTLRADRFGLENYARSLTPYMDTLGAKGSYFSNFHVPIARTAPSLVSMMTGLWPKTTGIRDNFVDGGQLGIKTKPLAQVLLEAGYHTSVVSDWTGSDFQKFQLGFERADVPEDQWNIKYFIRQGPKDLRLFLSLFVQNPIGKRLLPEIYYLAGVALNDELVDRSIDEIQRLNETGKPFFLNVFMGTTHPPFGSEYPFYTLYADPDYGGESKFAMAKLTDPAEVIRSQREPREAFDLQQIVDLYDGAVRRFDAAVESIVGHLDQLGLSQNTLIVLYSDHGMELFENNTWGQGNSVYSDHSSRVPLLICPPKGTTVRNVSKVTRSVDLMPTLLSLLGHGVPSGLDGVNLQAYLNDPDADLRLYAYTETGIWLDRPPGMCDSHLMYPHLLELLEVPDKRAGTLVIKPRYADLVLQARDRAIRTDRWKLVCEPHESDLRWRLFDLQADPNCRHHVANAEASTEAELRSILETFLDL